MPRKKHGRYTSRIQPKASRRYGGSVQQVEPPVEPPKKEPAPQLEHEDELHALRGASHQLLQMRDDAPPAAPYAINHGFAARTRYHFPEAGDLLKMAHDIGVKHSLKGRSHHPRLLHRHVGGGLLDTLGDVGSGLKSAYNNFSKIDFNDPVSGWQQTMKGMGDLSKTAFGAASNFVPSEMQNMTRATGDALKTIDYALGDAGRAISDLF